jgi:quinol-cytochrome oxidoreductase complex cytochrome b subunit
MVAAVILHQMRVFFTGAFRKPREINWMVGMFLLLSTLVAGFTGSSGRGSPSGTTRGGARATGPR